MLVPPYPRRANALLKSPCPVLLLCKVHERTNGLITLFRQVTGSERNVRTHHGIVEVGVGEWYHFLCNVESVFPCGMAIHCSVMPFTSAFDETLTVSAHPLEHVALLSGVCGCARRSVLGQGTVSPQPLLASIGESPAKSSCLCVDERHLLISARQVGARSEPLHTLGCNEHVRHR